MSDSYYVVVAHPKGRKIGTGIIGVFRTKEQAQARAEQRREYNRRMDDDESVTVRKVSTRNTDVNVHLQRRGFG